MEPGDVQIPGPDIVGWIAVDRLEMASRHWSGRAQASMVGSNFKNLDPS